MKIQIDKPAMKLLVKQPKPQQERLLKAIYKLPTEGDIKPMSGYDGLYRLRVGTYHILFTVEDEILTVRVLQIGNRGDIYK